MREANWSQSQTTPASLTYGPAGGAAVEGVEWLRYLHQA